jgi:hypothetical protein
MLRKAVIAVATVATIGAAALAPTEAAAKLGKHSYGLGWGITGLALSTATVTSCYRWVQTYYGLVRVNVCY